MHKNPESAVFEVSFFPSSLFSAKAKGLLVAYFVFVDTFAVMGAGLEQLFSPEFPSPSSL